MIIYNFLTLIYILLQPTIIISEINIAYEQALNSTCVKTFLTCLFPPITINPTVYPSIKPTIYPSIKSTLRPTIKSTIYPSIKPIVKPTSRPTIKPTIYPSIKPTLRPTSRPTIKPTFKLKSNTALCRDAWQHPFLSTSIWNTPIGSNAIFYSAGIFITHEKPLMLYSDIAYFIKTTSSDPVTLWYNQVSWSQTADHCAITSSLPPRNIIFPSNFTQTIYGNNVGSVLNPDGQNVVQMLQLYRCEKNSPVLASVKGNTNIYTSNGTYGSHGGSGLSGIGGCIRPGELLPNTPDISHSLNLQIYAAYYYYKSLDSNGVLVPGSCRTWPAIYCDGESSGYGGTNPYLKMGSLLAVPLHISGTLNIQTIPGKKILNALTYYGGYIKDSQGINWATMALDNDAITEFRAYYGYNFMVRADTKNTAALKFYDDIVLIFQSLSIVTNNAANSLGGGGTPLASKALPFC